MKRFLNQIINAVKYLFVVSLTFVIFPFARLFFYRKKIWIITENRRDARDNGFVLFRHIRTVHKNINCYYAIDFDSIDYNKVKNFGNVIRFGGLRHFTYFCAAKYIISTKTEGFCPSYYLTLLRKHFHLFGKYIFLQHGITKDDQTHFYKSKAKFDLFICGAKPEFDDISMRYGYSKNEVKYTGFSRFDTYHGIDDPKRQILIMPTWRRGLTKNNIVNSKYYRAWQDLLNSKKLNAILKQLNVSANFYIHPQFQNFSYLFKTSNNNINITDFSHSDLQELIRTSVMLITDFSSVFFDFGYMKRPVLYYQFDESTFFESHYIKGYFDYRKDGFGPICNTIEETLDSLLRIGLNNFKMDKKSLLNSGKFFPLNDANNSERIYLSILEIN